MSKILKEDLIETPDCRWVKLKKITWQDPNGKEQFWEAAFRPTRKGAADAVGIIPIVKRKGQPDKIILVSQFRPPTGGSVIEFCAGLVDEGETFEEAALRELKEETGFVGDVSKVSPICWADPGMTNANIVYVKIEVDGDDPRNLNPESTPDEGEFIQVITVPVDNLLDFLNEKEREGYQCDARLYGYALGYGPLTDKLGLSMPLDKKEPASKSNLLFSFLGGMIFGLVALRLMHAAGSCKK
mmetsp:Transcript_35777/g.47221  ORF Transcript_35777/g.47221 Transcript_35777/m.47221 type:complete len:242 (-) Transcript_35777:331-1056(-)|eukprot:CAMPEP_0117752394 /NCGR_PEP_ID=MMETSP0947-20121206/11581_1 /TAXON_ID=44440 /ORGANISM="Chattonella subsalsa, Strain CCMP2191" /LENGTH=241 /DNA_ID=CAMNT_0005571031 /DNA_START=69 /DNA_END=794 /DNA_ORIENTATION=+